MEEAVIFLDFDGVILTPESYRRLQREHKRFEDIEPERPCLDALNRLIRETGAKIVASSSWRDISAPQNTVTTLLRWGVEGEVVGVTPRLCPSERENRFAAVPRGLEIASWLIQHGARRFVILDDCTDMSILLPHLVCTNEEVGLTEADVTAALGILQKGITLAGNTRL